MRTQVFWDVTPCRLVNSCRRLDPETSVIFQKSTRLNITDDLNFQNQKCIFAVVVP
jgi:hypothetical protein